MTDLITYRPAMEDDFNFITATWFKSQRKETKLDKEVYNKTQGARIIGLLDESVTIVAVLTEDASVIVGYITFMPDKPLVDTVTVHYVYVKNVFRGNGIGGNLLSLATGKNEFYYTFDTKRKINNGSKVYG